MPGNVALQRYLQRHLEPSLPPCNTSEALWRHALVIPAYREAASLVQRLQQLPAGSGKTLVILVLNRPDNDPDTAANSALRTALKHLPAANTSGESTNRLILNEHTELYLHDMEKNGGPIAADLGVGLARKTGCDLALQWMHEGAISGQWICSTDADATLPPDYFKQLESITRKAVAVVFPFLHVPGTAPAIDRATTLYELRLHQYVLGLEYAGSPYAHHTLGSCLAVKADAYAQVRGFPKRAGAEDFYLLNKLAKLGAIARTHGQSTLLQSRPSDRIPFGTGPAVAAISRLARPEDEPLFYHPQCFEALRVLLASVDTLAQHPAAELEPLLVSQGLAANLALQSRLALSAMDIEVALQHCQRQGKSPGQFQRQFHQWFDGFRSLKFIHAIRDSGWPQQSLAKLASLQPTIWPGSTAQARDVTQLQSAIREHWGWRDQGG